MYVEELSKKNVVVLHLKSWEYNASYKAALKLTLIELNEA